MRELQQHGDGNAMGLRNRFLPLQHGEAFAGFSRLLIRELAHDVFSRASVKNPLSARSCNIAITSAAIASRGAVYFSASSPAMSATLRTPSQSFNTSTAISSGASTRSGA